MSEYPNNRCLCNYEYEPPCPYCQERQKKSRPRKPGKTAGMMVTNTISEMTGIKDGREEV